MNFIVSIALFIFVAGANTFFSEYILPLSLSRFICEVERSGSLLGSGLYAGVFRVFRSA